ncbi:class I mannose-6-phosphate isomerase [Halanaerobium salsuginis]|uniref:Mannose-6-phosphate isomerase, class I n=1 Tax=Halanaerobium salsuginis TaxID=29563 RepID=A0A1I4J921_9FIRM|nr:class I mannose-6-phosphate isomerase [Halanaerobium salsuginis]SFL63072.1 Mannose-6-phosphate isomerase, class I [Halanaerobium salsuginis]
MKRKTEQLLLPVEKKINSENNYDIFPSYELSPGKINVGFEKLAKELVKHEKIIMDGYGGVFWQEIKDNLDQIFKAKGISVSWHNIADALLPEKEIAELVAPFLGGDDPIFGSKFTGEINDFFDKKKLNSLSEDNKVDLNIVYGTGAKLVDWTGYLVYIDIPKNEIQYRARAEEIYNLGLSSPAKPHKMYKQFYFVDWVVLNLHKKAMLTELDLIIDGQRTDQLTFMFGDEFRTSLTEISKNYFRVRPWFEPGSWGGQWMKKRFSTLPQNVSNYAWSFELIVPENGIIFESNKKLLEVSFDFLMYNNSEAVLGEQGAERFGNEFPIRIDYLDTVAGGNLSIQCHPKTDYIKKHFGENFTQDETYYIIDSESNSGVYLGFQENIDPEEFRKVLENSRDSLENDQVEDIPVEIEKYVQKITAEKHDLFLIPNGTIHGSGSGNLVLEISSTPYIFTFKLYDWLRKSPGKPRPINIERGFENLCFDRKGEKVKAELVSKPDVIEKNAEYKILHLPTHQQHFYDVYRLEFKNEIKTTTDGSCNVMVVVEGESIILETKSGKRARFNYGETFVIPAAAEQYKLINESNKIVKVLKVFLK